MPLLRSPDGSETLEVPLEQVRYYISKGASLAQPLSGNEGARPLPGGAPYSGTPDESTAGSSQGGVPWWGDPTDLPAMFLAGPAAQARPMIEGASSMLSAAGSAAGRVATSPAARTVGGAAAKGAVELLPWWARIPARAAMNAPRAAAEAGGEQAASAGQKAAAGALLGKATSGAGAGASRSIVGGAEAAAYKAGGQPGLDAFRAETAKVAQSAAEVPKGKIRVPEHFRAKPKPKLRVVEKPEPKLPPSVQKRIAAGKEAGPRHQVQYFSKSRGEHVNIEDMNQKHIEHAIRRIAATDPKPGSVARKQLDALLAETKHRAVTTGIHIGQAEAKAGGGKQSFEEAAKYRPWLKRQVNQ